MCKACWDAGGKEKDKAYHIAAGCEANHAKFVAGEAAKAAALDAGLAVRCAAVGLFDGSGLVKVWFQRKGLPDLMAWMPGALYDAFPLGELVVLGDYERRGEASGLKVAFAAPAATDTAVL